MAPKPSYEELEAQVAALRTAFDQQSSVFTREVSKAPSPYQEPNKTSQSTRVQVPTSWLARAGTLPVDPIVIQGQIDQITTVITSGVNSAGYGDKRTEFRSLSELRQILDGLKDDLAGALGYGGRVRQIRMTTQADKGL